MAILALIVVGAVMALAHFASRTGTWHRCPTWNERRVVVAERGHGRGRGVARSRSSPCVGVELVGAPAGRPVIPAPRYRAINSVPCAS
ncbi:hypothetical protein QJS66_18125 [Kocuria rhizophila]|nr:hypothetical protein QJS66_18125 [Kocuria rhizophila]